MAAEAIGSVTFFFVVVHGKGASMLERMEEGAG
jgi:hypothetical protein